MKKNVVIVMRRREQNGKKEDATMTLRGRAICALLAFAVLVAAGLAFWTSLNLFVRGNVLASYALFWLGFIAGLYGCSVIAVCIVDK